MIQVLHIDTEESWRGGQQQVAYLVEGLFKKGFTTALVCQANSTFEKYCEDKNLPYFSMLMLGEMDFLAGYRIAKVSKKLGFNVLHLHSAHALAIGMWAKLFCRDLKLIAVRRVDFHIKNNWFSRFKYNGKLLDRIVCVSDRIKNILIEDGIEPEKLVTIHSGIDTHKFEKIVPPNDFREKFGIPQNHILVGTVAAIVDHKDYPNLMRAAKIVIEKLDHVTFCAVGDGPDKNQVLKLANELNLNNRFIFTGFRNDVGNFLKSFDVFVMASKLEGLGSSILDAFSVGLPVAACRAGGIPEMVSHNKNGILVPPQNPQALADAIISLVKDQDLRKRLGQNALKTVTEFDVEVTINKNIKLYKEICSLSQKQKR